ncbi:hypothetical protein HGM15179_013059, partial [Zosterops borbonicus]
VCSFSRLPSFHAASLELQFVTLERNTEILLREEFPDASFPLLSLQIGRTSANFSLPKIISSAGWSRLLQ